MFCYTYAYWTRVIAMSLLVLPALGSVSATSAFAQKPVYDSQSRVPMQQAPMSDSQNGNMMPQATPSNGKGHKMAQKAVPGGEEATGSQTGEHRKYHEHHGDAQGNHPFTKQGETVGKGESQTRPVTPD